MWFSRFTTWYWRMDRLIKEEEWTTCQNKIQLPASNWFFSTKDVSDMCQQASLWNDGSTAPSHCFRNDGQQDVWHWSIGVTLQVTCKQPELFWQLPKFYYIAILFHSVPHRCNKLHLVSGRWSTRHDVNSFEGDIGHKSSLWTFFPNCDSPLLLIVFDRPAKIYIIEHQFQVQFLWGTTINIRIYIYIYIYIYTYTDIW